MAKYDEQSILERFKVENIEDITPELMVQHKGGHAGPHEYADRIDAAISLFDIWKNKIKKGEMNITDYATKMSEFTPAVAKDVKTLSGIHSDWTNWTLSRAGNELAPYIKFSPTGTDPFAEPDFKVPFTRSEYSKLDASVLPTEQDISSGLLSRDSIPFQRFRNTAEGAGGTDAQGNPIPADINLGSDRGAVELEAQRQAGQLQGTLDEQKALRDQNRTQLAQILAQQQDESFQRAIPTLAEDANAKGILRSTGFGEKLAQKYTDLTTDTKQRFAEQELADSEKYVGGLGDIANVRAGFQTSGLQRDFSLDDAARSETLARELAKLAQPSGSSGKSGGEKWAQGIQTGAQVVDAFRG